MGLDPLLSGYSVAQQSLWGGADRPPTDPYGGSYLRRVFSLPIQFSQADAGYSSGQVTTFPN